MTSATAAASALATGSTREQILAVARGFIETRSYLGFSFQDVADAVGVRKASLYHHFPSKEALGIAVIRAATQSFKDWDAAREREPKDAGALAPGWDVINDELREAVRELRSTQVTWLTGVLGALMPARKKGASVASLAAYVFSACQGALLSARMTGRVDEFDEAIAQLRSSLPG